MLTKAEKALIRRIGAGKKTYFQKPGDGAHFEMALKLLNKGMLSGQKQYSPREVFGGKSRVKDGAVSMIGDLKVTLKGKEHAHEDLDLTRTSLFEEVTRADLKNLERYFDAIFAKSGIDLEFTKHFFDRVNDRRNKKPITVDELRAVFNEVALNQKLTNKIKGRGNGFEAVLKDVSTAINVPFVLNYDRKNKELDLVTKTIMRKKGFKTHGKVFTIKTEDQLDEAFDKASEYKWSKSSAGDVASFTISANDGKDYHYNVDFQAVEPFDFSGTTFEGLDTDGLWDLTFSIVEVTDRQTKATSRVFAGVGLANLKDPRATVRVFGTVIAIAKDFIKRRKVKGFIFTASEPSRKKLYRKMISTTFKQVGLTHSKIGRSADGDGLYVVTKEPAHYLENSMRNEGNPEDQLREAFEKFNPYEKRRPGEYTFTVDAKTGTTYRYVVNISPIKDHIGHVEALTDNLKDIPANALDKVALVDFELVSLRRTKSGKRLPLTGNKYGVRDLKDPAASMRVFGSVLNVIAKESKSGGLTGIYFSAEESSRRKLYKTMINRLKKTIGFKYVYEWEDEGQTSFLLSKNEVAVPVGAMESLNRSPLKLREATTTASIAGYMKPLGDPIQRTPLRTLGKHCKDCKKLGYICPGCEPVVS